MASPFGELPHLTESAWPARYRLTVVPLADEWYELAGVRAAASA
jgi:hypothetical protein